MKTDKIKFENLSSVSSDKISIPAAEAGNANTCYGSAKVLGKVGASPTRAPQYMIENLKK